MSKTFSLIIIYIGLFSCSSNKDNISNQNKYYIVNTKEFREKEKSLKCSLNEAVNIYAEYKFKIAPEKEIYACLDIIYGDYYVFKEKIYDPKFGYYYLAGIWVNGETKSIENVETNKKIKLDLSPSIHLSFCKKIDLNNEGEVIELEQQNGEATGNIDRK